MIPSEYDNKFTMSLFGSLMANVFNPMQDNTVLPKLPKVDVDKYNNASREEQSVIIQDAINNDSFWGKFFRKIKNKGTYQTLIDATKEIDSQIAELNNKRWDIIKKWVEEESNP